MAAYPTAYRYRISSLVRSAAVVLLLLALSGNSFAREAEQQPRVAFLGVWDRALPLIERASREVDLPVAFLQADDLNLQDIRVLYVLNFNAAEAVAIKKKLQQASQANSGLQVVPLDFRDSHAELERANLLHHDKKVPTYWRANGLVNIRRLLQYTAITYLGRQAEVQPPVVVPDTGYYHPTVEDAIPTFQAFRSAVGWKQGAPVAAMLIQQSFWVTRDTKVINAEIEAMEKQGFNVVTLFADTDARMAAMLTEIKPDIIIEDRHGSSFFQEGGKTLLEKLDVPYMRPISMLAYTIDEWMQDPRGLAARDRSLFLTVQEPKGTIEPIVIGGLKASIRGFHLHQPVPGRAEHFAQRAAAWVNLQREKNADKHVVIIYFNKYLGKSDLMRGSPTGGFLDGPQSLMRFLPRLKKAGYTTGDLPASADELIDMIREHGRNIGPWAQGELDALADGPDAVLMPASQYEQWFQTRLDEQQRQAVIERFGPPPGKLMVVTRNNRPYLVIPAIRLGNILLAPQPERGEAQDDSLLHSRDVPPPHNYLAFYWWLQTGYKADAILHWGTHGSLELLPGKEAGLSAEDWSDVCTGTMPVINPWIMDNVGEATLSRRRSYAVLVDHLAPPAVNAGLTDELQHIHENIDKFESLEPGLLREKFRNNITEATRDARVDETLKIYLAAGAKLTDAQIEQVKTYLHEVYNSTTPTSLHILGQAPQPEQMVPYLVTILRKPFLQKIASLYPETAGDPADQRTKAEEIVRETVLGDQTPPAALKDDIEFARDVLARLEKTDGELANLLRALSGHYIPPGPGPEPVRNPASVPSGRNLYGLNPEEIPTRPSWEVAVQLVDDMLKTRNPQKVGFDLNGMNTMRDFGVIEAQILYLMGVKPLWDRNNLAVDVELIPISQLNRPRIDVFVAIGGQYKENFPSRVKLIDKAVRLAGSADEPENLVRKNSQRLHDRLLARGFSEEKAENLAAARVFGTKPGNMSGTNILYLIPRSGVWEKDDEVASVYIDSMSYAYTGDIWGQKINGLYEAAIQGTDTLIRAWSSNMTSQLSNHHAYEYLGGLNMAVTKLTGRQPAALIADVRDADAGCVRDFEEVLATNFRTELLNRKWIEGMKKNDYAGAGQIAELVKNTFGWNVTRKGCVTDGTWNDIYKTYVEDRYELGLQKWFEAVNPHALQEIAATLLEASRKGYWKADPEKIKKLTQLYAESVAKFGPSSGLVSGGNKRLNDYVEKTLDALSDKPLIEEFTKTVAESSGKPGEDKVRGPKLEKVDASKKQEQQKQAPSPAADFWWIGILIGAAALFAIGLLNKPGTPS